MNTKINRMNKMIADGLMEQKADAVVVMSPENVFYASEIFIVAHRWIPLRLVMVVFHQDALATFIICDNQEGFIRSENGWLKDIRVYIEYVESPIKLLADVLKEKGLSNNKVLIEKKHLNAMYYEELMNLLPGCKFEDCGPLLDDIRQVKTPEEISLLQENARLMEKALLGAYKDTRPGDTEKSVAACAIANLTELGYDTVDILTLCSGKTIFSNTRPTNYRLQKGDMLRIDFVGTRNGYRGDLNRQAILGEPSAAQEDGYKRYIEALQATIDKTVIGMLPCELYEACRTEHKKIGLQMNLPHIGHGLGVGLHEYPSISPLDKSPIIADMVVNIEPIGVDPKVGGYGQETTIHVTENGPVVISDYTDLSSMYVINI